MDSRPQTALTLHCPTLHRLASSVPSLLSPRKEVGVGGGEVSPATERINERGHRTGWRKLPLPSAYG